jgi:hypothetical protein
VVSRHLKGFERRVAVALKAGAIIIIMRRDLLVRTAEPRLISVTPSPTSARQRDKFRHAVALFRRKS